MPFAGTKLLIRKIIVFRKIDEQILRFFNGLTRPLFRLFSELFSWQTYTSGIRYQGLFIWFSLTKSTPLIGQRCRQLRSRPIIGSSSFGSDLPRVPRSQVRGVGSYVVDLSQAAFHLVQSCQKYPVHKSGVQAVFHLVLYCQGTQHAGQSCRQVGSRQSFRSKERRRNCGSKPK